MRSKLTLTLFAILTMLFIACGGNDKPMDQDDAAIDASDGSADTGNQTSKRSEITQSCIDAEQGKKDFCMSLDPEDVNAECTERTQKMTDSIINDCGDKVKTYYECKTKNKEKEKCESDAPLKECLTQYVDAMSCIDQPDPEVKAACESFNKKSNCPKEKAIKCDAVGSSCTTENLAYYNCLNKISFSTCDEATQAILNECHEESNAYIACTMK